MEFIEFTESNKYKYVKGILDANGLLNETAIFASYHDHILVYELMSKGVYYEFSFISDDFILRSIKVEDLLNLKRIVYFKLAEFKDMKRRLICEWTYQ